MRNPDSSFVTETLITVTKRDGSIVNFDPTRITTAILKAGNATGEFYDMAVAEQLANIVMGELFTTIHSDNICLGIEVIQDVVENVLMNSPYKKTAKAYIKYRAKNAEHRDDKNSIFANISSIVEDYVDKADWRVSENSSMGHSYQGLILHMAGSVQARYVLEKYYDKDIAKAHSDAFFHIHDLSFGMAGYCAGWSLRDLLLEGFNLPGKCCSSPAKHFDTALGQIVNFLGTLQNEWAGAQAFNNFDTYLAPFVKMDNLEYKVVKQYMQRFVYNMNTSSRWGGQAPFSNLTFDMVCPKHMKDEPIIMGGAYHESLTYGNFQNEMDLINKAFIEIMTEGDMHGRIHSYPIPTYNVTPAFPWETENGEMLLKLTAKYGAPYFQNFINSDIDPEDVRSMCCRLQMDLREIRKKTGGIFGAGDLTGSIGVVTLNLPKYAYLANGNEDVFREFIKEFATLAKKSLEIKRKKCTQLLKQGMFPFTKRYLKNEYRGHFSTIGLVGGNEACLNLIGKGIETPEGQELMIRTLNYTRELISSFQEETGNLYNFEATPAESTSYRLAKIDKKFFKNIITSGTEEAPYYTNSTLLPVGHTEDVFEALEHQDKLQTIYNGGTVFHSFFGEAEVDYRVVKDYLISALSNTKLPYISITPTFSVCKHHGYINGEHFQCPTCGEDSEVYTRIVGYYRPVQRWNTGKQQEYQDRKEYSMEMAKCRCSSLEVDID